MGIKTVTVVTCDGPTGHPDLHKQGEVAFQVNDRVFCFDCLEVELGYLMSGQVEGPFEVDRFDPDDAEAMARPVRVGENGESKENWCYDCVPPRGPFKALSAHRRKYHGKFVRGPRAVREPPSPAIPFDRAEAAEAVAESRRTVSSEEF